MRVKFVGMSSQVGIDIELAGRQFEPYLTVTAGYAVAFAR